MLKNNLLELLVRGIPESFISMLGVYAFSKTIFRIKPYLISSLVLFFGTILIRSLPINTSYFVMLIFLLIVILSITIVKTGLSRGIKGSIVTYIFLIVTESFNTFLLFALYGKDIKDRIASDATYRTLHFIPSTLVFALIIITSFVYLNRKRLGTKNGTGGKKNSPPSGSGTKIE